MAEDQAGPSGPDLAQGIAFAELADGGKLVGHVGGEPVLLVRRGTNVFAIGAHCTHYSGPLVDGLIVDDTVRCPWHHACFDLRTGEALRAPALSPVASWSVEQRDGRIFVRERRGQPEARPRSGSASAAPKRIAIVGEAPPASPPPRCFDASNTKARSSCSAMTTRRRSTGRTSQRIISRAPRRKNGFPCAPDSFYSDNGIDLRLKANVVGLDARAREVALADGSKVPLRPTVAGDGR